MPRIFLSAEWRRLAIVSYDVDPSLLDEHLPPDCVADVRDGRAYVSLVPFEFVNTRVLGICWPGFTSFPEINLRAYVRHKDGRHGVTFIREFVPQKLVAAIARWSYNEPYMAVPMRTRVLESDVSIEVDHIVTVADRTRRIRTNATKPLWMPDENSMDHFFKEHEWGFGKSKRGAPLSYRVQHPRWRVYREPRVLLEEWNFADVYGPKWSLLNDQNPMSVLLTEGSKVTVSARI
ncbi:MAG TPA: DUF2071 domain-containing protein [Tepidisphaeraceae bacterium]|nr:DUF2071 domain-containing protein [Tepidisphaeraceae bacterium]